MFLCGGGDQAEVAGSVAGQLELDSRRWIQMCRPVRTWGDPVLTGGRGIRLLSRFLLLSGSVQVQQQLLHHFPPEGDGLRLGRGLLRETHSKLV